MLTIPADIILEKNKLFTGEAFIELFEWQISETSEVVRVANYSEDVKWGGYIWTKFWFENGEEEDTGGDSPETVKVSVSAVDKTIQTYIESLTNEGSGDTVIYRRVHSGFLNLGAALTASFEIMDIDFGPSNEFVIFNLGQENFFLSQFPGSVIRRNVCRYRPTQTDVCIYVNNSACQRVLGDCLRFGQEAVFGGQPGVPEGVFNFVASTLGEFALEDGDELLLEDGEGLLLE